MLYDAVPLTFTTTPGVGVNGARPALTEIVVANDTRISWVKERFPPGSTALTLKCAPMEGRPAALIGGLV